jgi:hypothetical protein
VDTDGTASALALLNQQSGPSVITTAIRLRLGASREAMSAPTSSAAAPTAHQAKGRSGLTMPPARSWAESAEPVAE